MFHSKVYFVSSAQSERDEPAQKGTAPRWRCTETSREIRLTETKLLIEFPAAGGV